MTAPTPKPAAEMLVLALERITTASIGKHSANTLAAVKEIAAEALSAFEQERASADAGDVLRGPELRGAVNRIAELKRQLAEARERNEAQTQMVKASFDREAQLHIDGIQIETERDQLRAEVERLSSLNELAVAADCEQAATIARLRAALDKCVTCAEEPDDDGSLGLICFQCLGAARAALRATESTGADSVIGTPKASPAQGRELSRARSEAPANSALNDRSLRLRLLAKKYGQGSRGFVAEDQARLTIVTERLRRAVVRVTESDVSSLESAADLLEHSQSLRARLEGAVQAPIQEDEAMSKREVIIYWGDEADQGAPDPQVVSAKWTDEPSGDELYVPESEVAAAMDEALEAAASVADHVYWSNKDYAHDAAITADDIATRIRALKSKKEGE